MTTGTLPTLILDLVGELAGDGVEPAADGDTVTSSNHAMNKRMLRLAQGGSRLGW
jgi:hypothetical protein